MHAGAADGARTCLPRMVSLRAAAAALLLAGVSAAAAEGLLIGLRLDRGRAASTYRAVWIAPGAPGSLHFNSLLVRREGGWWKAGVKRWQGSTSTVDLVWAHRAGEASWAANHRVQTQPDCSVEEQAKILFLGPDHVTIETNDYGYCKEAAGPNVRAGLKTVALASVASPPGNDDAGLRFADTFPEHAGQFAKGVPAALARVQDEGIRGCLEQQPAPESWGLVRRNGAWVLRTRLADGATPCRGLFQDADIPVAAPESLTGPAGQTTLAVRKLFPGAKDWIASPGGDLLAVVTARSIALHEIREGQAVRPALANVPLTGRESIVSVQWAPPSEVVRWTVELQAMTVR